MSTLMNLSRSVFVALTLLGGFLGGSFLDTLDRLIPLDEGRMAAATGLDRDLINMGFDTCDEIRARGYTDAVPEGGCNSGNAGTTCVRCDSSGTNVQLRIATITSPRPPGYVRQPNESCGKEYFGICTYIDGSAACSDQEATINNCSSIQVWHNQPAQ